MTRKVYRTAQGKMVDLGALQLQNEQVRAVGNMKVNARGDLVDSQDRSIDSRNQQVARQYKKQVSNVKDQSVIKKAPETKSILAPAASQNTESVKTDSPVESAEAPSGGLAAAIARARQIRQDPIRTAQDIAQNLAPATSIDEVAPTSDNISKI
jgi:hypothetical protein